jgi:hypothetical protein
MFGDDEERDHSTDKEQFNENDVQFWFDYDKTKTEVEKKEEIPGYV